MTRVSASLLSVLLLCPAVSPAGEAGTERVAVKLPHKGWVYRYKQAPSKEAQK